MLCTGDPSYESGHKPSVFVIGLRTIAVKWNPIPCAIEYIINCINLSSGQSNERYTQKPQTTFDELSQSDLYEFQVAAFQDGRRTEWSEKSFPVKPTMQLGFYFLPNLVYFTFKLLSLNIYISMHMYQC